LSIANASIASVSVANASIESDPSSPDVVASASTDASFNASVRGKGTSVGAAAPPPDVSLRTSNRRRLVRVTR